LPASSDGLDLDAHRLDARFGGDDGAAGLATPALRVRLRLVAPASGTSDKMDRTTAARRETRFRGRQTPERNVDLASNERHKSLIQKKSAVADVIAYAL